MCSSPVLSVPVLPTIQSDGNIYIFPESTSTTNKTNEYGYTAKSNLNKKEITEKLDSADITVFDMRFQKNNIITITFLRLYLFLKFLVKALYYTRCPFFLKLKKLLLLFAVWAFRI